MHPQYRPGSSRSEPYVDADSSVDRGCRIALPLHITRRGSASSRRGSRTTASRHGQLPRQSKPDDRRLRQAWQRSSVQAVILERVSVLLGESETRDYY